MSNVARRTRSQKSSQTENYDQVAHNENITGTDLNEDKPLSTFGYWYLQYCLVTGLYMLEPWERKLFNSVVFVGSTIASLVLYFIAGYIYKAFL
ncbi:small subunit of serine palmitoyltransferase-like domain-containing protein [Ditylenchus destructor]|nr:small subunit of serine palmitoyltransferase-like domain-containing protein [Ditylenchus destructor]